MKWVNAIDAFEVKFKSKRMNNVTAFLYYYC